ALDVEVAGLHRRRILSGPGAKSLASPDRLGCLRAARDVHRELAKVGRLPAGGRSGTSCFVPFPTQLAPGRVVRLVFERRPRGVAPSRGRGLPPTRPAPPRTQYLVSRPGEWRGKGALADRCGVRRRALLRPVCRAAIPEQWTSRS